MFPSVWASTTKFHRDGGLESSGSRSNAMVQDLGSLHQTVDAGDVAGPPRNGAEPSERWVLNSDVQRSEGGTSSEVDTGNTVDQTV